MNSAVVAGSRHKEPGIEILELTSDKVKFVLTNVDLSMANSLRRAMIAEVPTLAIDVVTVEANSSVLNDQFLAHRLGLIPLDSTLVDQFNFWYDCSCQMTNGCDKCTVPFELRVRNVGDEVLHVTSDDLQFHHGFQIQAAAGVGSDPILLVKLGKNQEVMMSGFAKKGIGKEHSKWCPVAVATFAHDPIIKLDEALMDTLKPSEKKEFVDSCPTNVYGYNEDTQAVSIIDNRRCMFCEECVKKADSLGVPELVAIAPSTDTFIFTVEGTGVLTAEVIVSMALKQINKKLSVLETELSPIHE